MSATLCNWDKNLDTIDHNLSHIQVLDASSSSVVEVPEFSWLRLADFVRQGADLLLVGPNGKKILVENYFSQNPSPDLLDQSGAVFHPDLVSSLAGPRAPGQFAQNVEGEVSEPIGRIETITGSVEIARADGSKGTIAKDDPIFQGDVIQTGSDGNIGILLADDSVFSLDSDARAVMDEMVFDPGEQSGNLKISLVSGVMSFVSGQIAKVDPDAMTLKTPVATIGIRGTTGSIEAADTITVTLTQDPDSTVGEITVTTEGGVQVLNQPYQASQVKDPTQPPSQSFILSPEQFSEKFSGSMRAMNNTLKSSGREVVPEAIIAPVSSY